MYIRHQQRCLRCGHVSLVQKAESDFMFKGSKLNCVQNLCRVKVRLHMSVVQWSHQQYFTYKLELCAE